MRIVHLNAQNRVGQLRRRRDVQSAVDVGQMAAIELVELHAVGGIVLRPVPPAPVAAFGDQQFFERQLALRSSGTSARVIVGLRGRAADAPGLVVFFGADPHVEVGVDPGAGEDVVERLGLDAPRRLR